MKKVVTVCPYCASGCKINLVVDNGKIVRAEAALDYVATRLSAIKAKYGPDAIQTTGSSRGTGNETNYVMQKFARAVIGTNNVDCCARV